MQKKNKFDLSSWWLQSLQKKKTNLQLVCRVAPTPVYKIILVEFSMFAKRFSRCFLNRCMLQWFFEQFFAAPLFFGSRFFIHNT